MNGEELKFRPEEIIQMQEIVMKRIGGGSGIISMEVLESSAEAPFSGSGDIDFFPTVMDKAACYARSFDQKQVFIDGNKRVSVSVMLGWLARNGYGCTLSPFALHELMMDLANHSVSEAELVRILETHTEPTTKFEGMNLEEMILSFLETYEDTYVMLGAGAGDPIIDEWKEAMRENGDDGDYRK